MFEGSLEVGEGWIEGLVRADEERKGMEEEEVDER